MQYRRPAQPSESRKGPTLRSGQLSRDRAVANWELLVNRGPGWRSGYFDSLLSIVDGSVDMRFG